jgi:hypothetical protein
MQRDVRDLFDKGGIACLYSARVSWRSGME